MTISNQEIIDIWKKTIEVQKHFNDLCIRIRALAITIITAFIGALSYSFIKGEHLAEFKIISIPAAIAWFAFYIMDLKWYHKLLLGAVKHGIEKIERPYFSKIPEISLTSSIRDEAHKSIFGKHSELKLHLFYLIGLVIILFPWFLSVEISINFK